ncbi:hypothetical protein, partial [Klebsiella pneumoniae]|uniref:hypothetical protein n=1 Tax=Klebsiella pneumoniae TaxID=573 RepID=UPI002108B53C
DLSFRHHFFQGMGKVGDYDDRRRSDILQAVTLSLKIAALSTAIALVLGTLAAKVVGEVILVGNMPATVIGVADEKQSMFGSSKILRVWLPYTT